MIADDATMAASAVRAIGGQVTSELWLIDAVGATIPTSEISTLAAYPGVRAITNNKIVRAAVEPDAESLIVVNHEMRTPLTAIIGYTELILEGKKDLDPIQTDMLQRIKENGQRLVDLVNNLLDISCLEEGEIKLSPAPLTAMAVIDRALQAIQPLAKKKHISLTIDVPDTVPNIYGDPKRVDQVLVNLLSNAVKYTPDTGAVTIAADGYGANDMITISIADNGIGIPADQLPHIFDRFTRTERDLILNIVGSVSSQ
ncbi:MAG TPA: HAMP domain-containing histidine kinase [Chloroflexi bacterium]|nr:HAMP domain-containing histidine kinase [Chloroflexota bacterium]